jgi:hypothetical protein
MFICLICRQETESDDIVVRSMTGCVCLCCYGRETRTALRMPRGLRDKLIATLDAIEVE